jgi:hypothetical protein
MIYNNQYLQTRLQIRSRILVHGADRAVHNMWLFQRCAAARPMRVRLRRHVDVGWREHTVHVALDVLQNEVRVARAGNNEGGGIL